MISKYYSLAFSIVFLILVSCSGGNKPTASENSSPEVATESATPSTPNPDQEGKNLFLRYCMACHQTDGSGVPGMYPPIINSPIVNSGKKEDFINILLNGLKGPIEVHGKQFNQQMPKQDFLSDEDLAKIASYVATNFQNKAEKITPEEIKKQRGISPK